MPPGKPTQPTCVGCRVRPHRVVYGGIELCDACFDARVSAQTGWPRLPQPPPPETIRGPDGRAHHISYRVWRSPGGVVVEAEEGDPETEGYAAKIVAPHDADVAPLVTRVRAAIRRRIMHLDLEPSPHGSHWIMRGMDVSGRLVWQEDSPAYGVIVDGRELSWEEFGRALEPFEGWEFRLRIVEGLGDEDAPAEVEDRPWPGIFEQPPGGHAH